jgi:hypothetical protein
MFRLVREVWSLKTTKDLSECVNIRQSTQWLKGQTTNDLHRKQNIGNTNPTLNLGWNSGAPVGLAVSAPLMIPVLLFLSQNLEYGWNNLIDHEYVSFVVITIPSFPHSGLIIGFVTRITGLVSSVERKLLTLQEYLSYDIITSLQVRRSVKFEDNKRFIRMCKYKTVYTMVKRTNSKWFTQKIKYWQHESRLWTEIEIVSAKRWYVLDMDETI